VAKSRKKQKKETLSPEAAGRVASIRDALIDHWPVDDPLAVWTEELAETPDLAPAVAESMGRSQSQAALDFLAGLIPTLADKKTVKAAKKAVYQLKQGGLTPSTPTEPPSGILKPPPPREPFGYLGAFDPWGKRPAVLVLPAPGRGWEAIIFLFDAFNGVEEVVDTEMSGGELQTLATGLNDTHGNSVRKVPVEAVRLAIDDALDMNRQSGNPVPEEFAGVQSRVANTPRPAGPLIYDAIDAPAPEDLDGYADRVRRLAKHRYMLGFTPWQQIDDYRQRIHEVENSVLHLSELQIEERIDDIWRQSAVDLHQGPNRPVYRHMLEEAAYMFHLDGDEELARTAAAAAIELGRPPEPGRPDRVAVALFQDMWDRATAEEEVEDEEDDGRIVSEETAGSSLILPGSDLDDIDYY
jgi:hypothetical protein